jgi:L-glutamine-phosphate cytidylyltransferase
MKAIILAAGRGTRISRHIDGRPKCTVQLDDNTTLIEYTIELLHASGVHDIVIVLGYRGDVIRSVLAHAGVRFVENPFYDVTNSIASLWFARSQFTRSEPCLIMNGDVFLSQSALDLVLAEEESPVLFYDVTRRKEADYKFLCQDGRIVKYGKTLSLEETSGEYIGCARFHESFIPEFLARLETLIQSQQHSLWWEDVLYSMTAEHPILARDIEGTFWAEVDYVEDYQRIMSFYGSAKQTLHALSSAVSIS